MHEVLVNRLGGLSLPRKSVVRLTDMTLDVYRGRKTTIQQQQLYYKVYNLSCNQVGHDLIGRVQSLPNQIKVTASVCKHYVTMELLHDLA